LLRRLSKTPNGSICPLGIAAAAIFLIAFGGLA
jgi:hypothetical protein